MISFTVRTNASFDGAAREAVAAGILSSGGTARWHDFPSYGRCYGLIEIPGGERPEETLRAALPEGSTLYEGAIVALAIVPAQPEALPALLDALGGTGRPAGILACDPCAGALLLEFNPIATAPSVVWALFDVELQRWGGGRRAELLSPLADDAIAAIVAREMQAPEIAPSRVLETLLARGGLAMINTIASYVGLTDVIDVIATSILVYYLLLLIRGTRAVQILLGILVLVGLLGIANLLHLVLLGTILGLIVVGAAVTIPIVFQPELRRALEQIGRGGLFRLDSSNDPATAWTRAEDQAIVALAQAAFLLSRNKLGALIVIEQHSGLKEFCESGTILRAQLSAELLLAVFMPRSPLHDGAAIVRENLLEAAGCFLPLAEQSLADGRVGTRHRAALGLTEQTDAVVLVVSEETGAITIAREGKLSRPVEEEQRLTKMLLAVTRPPRRQRHLRNDLVSHLRSRLTSQRDRRKPRADHPKELRT